MNVAYVPKNVVETPIDFDSDENSQVEEDLQGQEEGNAKKPSRRYRAWDHFRKKGQHNRVYSLWLNIRFQW